MKNDFETVIKKVAAFLGKEVTVHIYPENHYSFFIKVIDSFIVAGATSVHMTKHL